MCNFDDGSCLLVFGCTDTALNFNPLQNVMIALVLHLMVVRIISM